MSSKGPDYYRMVPYHEENLQPAFFQEETGRDDDGGNEPPLGIRLHGGPKLNAQGYTGRGIKVGIIDNGIDSSHPLFHGKVTGGKTYRNVNREDHGTHVAGTIHMMAPEAELRDYRVFGRSGTIKAESATANAIMDAYRDGCDLINLSIGGRNNNSDIMQMVQYVQRKGVVLVAAACNRGDGDPMTNELGYPACLEETISIAAVKKENNLPVITESNSNPEVDYAGIGHNVKSFRNGGGYRFLTGTSMACPHVCGLIAALMSGPNASKFPKGKGRDAKVRELLKQYTIDIGLKGFDNSTGLGFVTFLSPKEFDNMFRDRTTVQSQKVHSLRVQSQGEDKTWV